MTHVQKALRKRLQRSLGMMEILESEIHTIMHLALSDACDEEEDQARQQQNVLRIQIRKFKKFLKG